MDRCHVMRRHGCDTCSVTEFDDLADEMAELLGAPCTVEDPDFNLIAYSGQSGVDAVRQTSILERRASREARDWFRGQGVTESPGPLRTPASPDLGIEARLCIPARHLGRLHALFWLLDPDEDIGPASWAAVERLAETAALLLSQTSRRRTRLTNHYRDLIGGDPRSTAAAAREIANTTGLSLGTPVTCVLVAYASPRPRHAPLPLSGPNLWFADSPDLDAVLVPGTAALPLRDVPALLESLGSPRTDRKIVRSARVGVGPTVPSLRHVRRSRWGAATALRATRAAGAGAHWDDLGVLRLLAAADDDALASALWVPGVTALQRQPDATELLTTLRVYLDEAGSVARTARRLQVHRQTIYHRLSRAEGITGLRLSSGQDRLQLHLALTLADHLGAEPPAAVDGPPRFSVRP